MYLSSKTSKHLLSKTVFTRVGVVASKATSNMIMCQQPSMGYFVVNQQQKEARYSLVQMQNMRSFSLPPHMKLEMPNLSPTMEKVRT